MLLKSTHIQHYKSLEDVRVTFHPNVTVFVGPNASGKSNLVDALRFLRDAAADDLDHAVSSRGGITRIRQTSARKPFNVSFRLDTEQIFSSREQPVDSFYALTLKSLTAGNYEVDKEEACFHEEVVATDENGWSDEGRRYLTSHSFRRDHQGQLSVGDDAVFGSVRTDQLALGETWDIFNSALGGAFLPGFISAWKFCAPYPNTLRIPTAPDKDTSLREDGTNWVSVVRAFKKSKEGRRALERIFEMMRMVLPGFQDVTVTTVGSYLVPRFKFTHQDGSGVREFDPVQLSDGTLRIFGILLSLYQLPSPPLLVLEEPEYTVHPGVLTMLAEALKEAAETTQIIITTHSPHLIDHFKPEHIRVVSMNGGSTQVAEVRHAQQQAVKQHLMTLGEFMAAEGLQPEGP